LATVSNCEGSSAVSFTNQKDVCETPYGQSLFCRNVFQKPRQMLLGRIWCIPKTGRLLVHPLKGMYYCYFFSDKLRILHIMSL